MPRELKTMAEHTENLFACPSFCNFSDSVSIVKFAAHRLRDACTPIVIPQLLLTGDVTTLRLIFAFFKGERYQALVLKNSVRRCVFPQGSFFRVRVFLAVECFLRGCHRCLRSPIEEPHQSFQVLCHGSEVELLTHELDSA